MPRDIGFGRKKRFQCDGRRDLAGADHPGRELVNFLMDRLEEMLRLEKIRDTVKRLVVHEDRAEQRLLRLDVVRSLTVIEIRLRGGFPEGQFKGHGKSDFLFDCSRCDLLNTFGARTNKNRGLSGIIHTHYESLDNHDDRT